MKTVLDLSASEARSYFMQPACYSNIPFPNYIKFDDILKYVERKIGKSSFQNCLSGKNIYPSDYDSVNYTLLMNKDGRYSYRPLQLINPYLYYFLVREITETNNWSFILKCFKEFRNSRCNVLSIPPLKRYKDKSITATSINSWWENVEQQSIKLSLQYKYIFITDVSNCYSSIYTHTISWALYGEAYAKKHKRENNLGNNIDKFIQGMQYGQTNGIPQGSILSDFIAEIVLGYSDKLLFDQLQKRKIAQYKILRYRDDYRIFCNSKEIAEIIAMELQKVLSSLNLHINTSKTLLSEELIETSIKEDKIFYVFNGPIYKQKSEKTSKKKVEVTHLSSLQQELLFFLEFSKKYPNSGTLTKLLTSFLRKLEGRAELSWREKQDVNVYIAIVVEIAMNNPKTYSISIAIISRFLQEIKSVKTKDSLCKKISAKFSHLPNIGYLQIWMQRLSPKIAITQNYDESLCRIVNQEPGINIWNNDWLKPSLFTDFPIYSIYQESEVKPIIDLSEVSIFDY